MQHAGGGQAGSAEAAAVPNAADITVRLLGWFIRQACWRGYLTVIEPA
ncbi:hypothetical protein [Streptomyces sp. NPDC002265]